MLVKPDREDEEGEGDNERWKEEKETLMKVGKTSGKTIKKGRTKRKQGHE
jgi:hypothetical protein